MCCCSNFISKRSCKEKYVLALTNKSRIHIYISSIYPTRWRHLEILSFRLRGQSTLPWIVHVLLQLLHSIQEITKFSSSLCFSSFRSVLILTYIFTTFRSGSTWSSVIRSISIALCQRISGTEQPTLRSNRRFKRSTEVAGSRANLIYSRYGKEVVMSRPTSSSSNSHWSNLSRHRYSFPMC